MRKLIVYAALCASLMAFSSCQKENTPSVDQKENTGFFDFSTTRVYDLSVDYKLQGYSTGIPFEVYTENPRTETTDEYGNPIVVRNDVKPVFKAITTTNGKFSGKISLPTYVKQIYVSTDWYAANDYAVMPVDGTSISVNMSNQPVQLVTKTRAGHTIPAGLYTLDGTTDWNDQGVPSYVTSGTVPDGLLNDVRKVLRSSRDVTTVPEYSYLVSDNPGVYRNHNINLAESASLEFVFLTSAATWHSAVAYYHYPTSTPPTSPSQITHPTIIFPHASGSGHGLVSGDRVKLKYWDGTQYVDKFPAGTTIGFILLPGAYSPTTGNIGKAQQVHYSYSDAALNMYGEPADKNRRQQTVALYNATRNVVVIGFEDRLRGVASAYNDNDFDDLLFYVNADPYKAIDVPDDHKDDDLDPKIPTPEPEPYMVEYSGTLAFEDLWPSKGDYDMNDVGLTYDCKVYYNIANKVVKVEDSFRAVRKGAKYTNGFGYQYGVPASAIKSVDMVATPSKELLNNGGLEAGQELATLVLFNDTEKEVSGPTFLYPGNTAEQKGLYEYTITTLFNSPQSIEAIGYPPYNPFIIIDQSKFHTPRTDGRLEVHLTNHMPTSLVSNYWFGRNDDRTDFTVPRVYISKLMYPFAINIPTKTFTFPAEGVCIDKVYPNFTTWVLSNGTQKADWYK